MSAAGLDLRQIYAALSSLSPEQRTLFARRLEESGLGAGEVLPRPPGVDLVPASPMQQRLWLLDQMEPGNPFYNLPLLCFRLRGSLDRDALERCFRELDRRHESLRTVFVDRDGEPFQRVLPPGGFALPFVDLSALPEAEREPRAWALAREEARRPFELARGPLWRAALLRLGRADHLLLVAKHHIVSDAWSLGVLHRELTALYEAFAAGRPSPLAELPVQYADVALWQRQRLQGELLAGELDFWRGQLAGAPDRLELPTDRPRPARRSFRGERRTLDLPPALPEALAGLAAGAGASLFMALLAGLDAVLYRTSGERDVVLGSPVAGRTSIATEGLIGFFVNTVVYRVRLAGELTFRALLARVRDVVLDVYEHQELPFDRLVEELRPRRDASHGPIYQVMFSLQNTPTPDLELPGLSVSPVGINNGTAQTDLILFGGMEAGRLGILQLEYDTDLFDAATIHRLEGYLLTLLAAAVADPDRPLADLPLMAAAERHQLLVEWNDSARDFPEAAARGDAGAASTIPELVARRAAEMPGAVALVSEGEGLTYAELDARAAALAARLRDRGVVTEGIVGVCAERSLELVIALLAVQRAGGAYLPLDPELPDERLALLLDDARPAVILAQPAFAERCATLGGAPVLALAPGADAGSAAPELPLEPLPGEAAAYVIYTSGSTGRPKGVVVSQRAVVNRLLWMQETYGLTPADRVLQKTPFTFDVSVWEFFWPLLVGARLVVARPGGHRDAGYLADVAASEGITTLHFVPSMLQAFLEVPGLERCRALRRLFASGEALPPVLVERSAERLPAGVEVHNLYGPTEAAVDVTFHHARPGAARVPIGRPVANTRALVLDRDLRPAPIGTPGELHLGGVQLARGYLGRPDLTAASFVPHPFAGDEAGARLYATGDRARLLPDGAIEYLGRLDAQVKVRGVRIEPGEVEAALAAHPAVAECAVAARELAPGDLGLVAWVAPAGGPGAATLGVEELRDVLRRRLPEALVPAVICMLPELPKTASGKLDRKALPAPERPTGGKGEPRTAMERVLAGLWRDLLGLPEAGAVGTEDDFFGLGGHSLLATRLVARLRDRLGIDLSARLVFQTPTLAAMARELEETVAAGAPAAAPALVRVARRAAARAR